jgi:hypothetical protein
MTTKADLYKIIYEILKSKLVPIGYKAGPKVFCRTDNELSYAIAFYKLPRGEAGELRVICEACVYSAALDLKLGNEPDTRWPLSQIRVRLDAFRPRVPGKFQESMMCRSPQEAEALADEIWCLLATKALPIIDAVHSTDDMIPIFRKGPHTLKSRVRARYDADVWEGKIDPQITPFVFDPNHVTG